MPDPLQTKEILRQYRCAVIVPFYNNAATVRSVIESVHVYTDDIIAVNDGSTDGGESALADLDYLLLIGYGVNRGKGYALRMAFAYAISKGFDRVITIDADGQHYAGDLCRFAEALSANPDALIVGARTFGVANMPGKNTFANKFSNFWFRVQTGIGLSDTQSGYRLYPLGKTGRMHFVSNRYGFEIEVLVRAAWAGIPVGNIGIDVYYPPASERVSHFRPFADFARISLLNTGLTLAALIMRPVMFLRRLLRGGKSSYKVE